MKIKGKGINKGKMVVVCPDWEIENKAVQSLCGHGFEIDCPGRMFEAAERLYNALLCFVDNDACRLDHHGFCQTHGGDPCRMVNAREAIDGFSAISTKDCPPELFATNSFSPENHYAELGREIIEYFTALGIDEENKVTQEQKICSVFEIIEKYIGSI